MYTTVIFLHSLVRWAVLATGVFAAIRGISGWRSGRPWTLADQRAAGWFTSALDLQMLLGLLLYFWLSPITTAALRNSVGGATVLIEAEFQPADLVVTEGVQALRPGADVTPAAARS